MNRRSSSKTNTRSRVTDEDGIRLSFSEANAQSESTDEDGIGPSIRIGVRHVYGLGIVTTIARLDTKAQRVIIEDHYHGSFTYTILPDIPSIRRMLGFLIMVQEHLPLKQSA